MAFYIVGIFRSSSFFMAANVRKAVAEGRGDFVPIFLQDIPILFEKKIVKPDVAIIQVCSFFIIHISCFHNALNFKINFTL